MENLMIQAMARNTRSQAIPNPEIVELRELLQQQMEQTRRQVELIEEQQRQIQTLLQEQQQQRQPQPEILAPVQVQAPAPAPMPAVAAAALVPPVVVAAPVIAREPLYERFRKQQPPGFEGESDPEIAEEWLRAIEEIFEFMELTDRERVLCAAHMLRKDARYWWDVVKQKRNVAVLTWAEFVVEFNNSFYTTAMLAQKLSEFSSLKQGSMSVKDYMRKFNRLARCAPDMVATDAARKTHFVNGLRPNIARWVEIGSGGPISCNAAVEQAYRAEASEAKFYESRSAGKSITNVEKEERTDRSKFRGKFSKGIKMENRTFGREQGKKPDGEGFQNKRKTEFEGQRRLGKQLKLEPKENGKPLCQKCNKRHYGECLLGKGVCFTCGKEGHFSRECPQKERQGGNGGMTNTRVFALTRKEAEASNANTVSGQLFIANQYAYTLLDSGATHPLWKHW